MMNRSGFTLVETMVAIAILTVAIAGPLYAAERATAAAYAAKDELTASYLGQEGIEYVRAMRDDTYLADYKTEPSDPTLAQDSWSDFLSGLLASSVTTCTGAGVLCTFDPKQNIGSALAACGGSGCTPLYTDGGGIYTQQSSGNTVTSFTRSIAFTALSSAAEKVVVSVSWKTDNTPYTISVSDTLTPWQ
ncbi:MAG: type IV pilus modification PilV family protein [Minisyncoccia bacterium]